MKKILLALALVTLFANAKYQANISTITQKIKQRMINGNSHRAGCPTPISNLRYITLTYIGFDGKEHIGELIVNKAVANDVVNIFKELYNIKYPIRKMKLVSNYNGSDFASIEADNTSAYNCRFVDGTNKWSNHSFGRAIDINPIENPYVSKSGHISHKKSLKFANRVHQNNTPSDKAMIAKYDKIVAIFKKYGWRWGGDWRCCKDYQHFDKKR
jgi:hypothetical protein